jgi:CheY-like chemotaxis protein/nitrogen-specific signal transduction histidine kinase
MGLINEALAAHLGRERARALEAQRIAEHAVQAKSRFLAAASHDLRQPLHAQGFFLGALERAARDTETAELVARIGDTRLAMQELLDSLLDISKLDAGTVVPSPRPFPLQQILDQLRSEFAEPAHAKGIALRIVPSSAWVRTDPVLVSRIVRNLVSNAVRYTEHGRVVVGCKRGPRVAKRPGKGQTERIRICVLDSGPGIPDDAHDAIFDEFVQLQNPERDRSRGIGLGLAIVRRLTALLGAEITLRSTVGRGSSFALALDRVAAGETIAVEPSPTSVREEAWLRGLRVLVVDDELMVIEALQRYLESLGCVVHAAMNGDEALSVLEAGLVLDVVVIDHRLRGEETGLAVLERLRAAAGRDLAAVVVTGDTAPERIREVAASGHPLLHKPVAASQLLATLRAVRAAHSS